MTASEFISFHLLNAVIVFWLVFKYICNQDALDFEWSFWTEWAKKSLLWTLIGHGVISRLMSIFCPKVESIILLR